MTFPTPGTFREFTPQEHAEHNRATVDCDGNPIRWLDSVQSASDPGHTATVGPVYPDGTFDVCDSAIGLFSRQRPEQWRLRP